MGAVVGYGVALQASCLEGFDSLGLHQVMRGSFNGKITGFHPVVKGSIPLPRTNLMDFMY